MDNVKRLEKLKESDYQKLFGIHKTTFEQILLILGRAYKELHSQGGRPPRLSVLDKLVVTLGYYRDYRTMENIAFDYSSATANEIPYERVLTHATRPEVALVGNNVETEGFDLVALGKRPSDTLTRNDMAMLLYNFLLSQYYDYGPAFDENLGRWVNVVQMSHTQASKNATLSKT